MTDGDAVLLNGGRHAFSTCTHDPNRRAFQGLEFMFTSKVLFSCVCLLLLCDAMCFFFFPLTAIICFLQKEAHSILNKIMGVN